MATATIKRKNASTKKKKNKKNLANNKVVSKRYVDIKNKNIKRKTNNNISKVRKDIEPEKKIEPVIIKEEEIKEISKSKKTYKPEVSPKEEIELVENKQIDINEESQNKEEESEVVTYNDEKLNKNQIIFNSIIIGFLLIVLLTPMAVLMYTLSSPPREHEVLVKTSLGKYLNFNYPTEWSLDSNQDGFKYIEMDNDIKKVEFVGEIISIKDIKEKSLDVYYNTIGSQYDEVKIVKLGSNDAISISYKSNDEVDNKIYIFYNSISNYRISLRLSLDKESTYKMDVLDKIAESVVLK